MQLWTVSTQIVLAFEKGCATSHTHDGNWKVDLAAASFRGIRN